MNLEQHRFPKGDSYKFTIKTNKPDLSGYTVLLYLNIQVKDITETPSAVLNTSDGLTITNMDGGAEVEATISPTLSTALENKRHYYALKAESVEERVTLSQGIIDFQTFMGDYYVNRFRRWIKDLENTNKGEFLNNLENLESDLEMYLMQAVKDFNSSMFSTDFDMDTFPSESLLFVGALLQALISNGVLNARCALTYQDAGGIIVSDMDRWGRYMQLFNQMYNYWKNGVTELKRSWNLEIGFGEIPSDMRWGGFDDDNILDANQWRL